MSNTWDQKTERRINHTDHDTLIEVVQLLKSQDRNALLLAENLKKHEEDDKDDFNKIRGDILGLQRIVWTATGIIIALDAIPKIFELLHMLK